MWKMLQNDDPADYVIATGESHSVREFCELAFKHVGIELEWKGSDISEKGIVRSTEFSTTEDANRPPKPGDEVVAIDSRYFRPTEVDYLLGDAIKAKQELGWEPSVTFEKLVIIMVDADVQEILNLQHSQDIIQQIINGNDHP